MAAKILKQRIVEYIEQALANITRHKDNEYSISLQLGGHTELAVLQEVIYGDLNVNFVSYKVLHPLKADTIIRIHTQATPESILNNAKTKLEEYCDKVEKDGRRS